MITVITGLPGNGKTLYALDWLRRRAASEGRQVYYSGIPDLRIPGWIELPNAEAWHTLPAKSIIVIDEAQRVFRPRMHGKDVPEHVAKLETHRHLGVDLVLVTQHPMLVDSNVRRLVGQHFHVVRKFGTKSATIHEWGAVKENCDKNREDSVQHPFAYPQDVFALYKSAEAHTHKARIPLKVWLFLSMPIILGVIAWFAYGKVSNYGKTPGSITPQISAGPAGVSRGAAAPVLTPAQYVENFAPRVPGLAYTAPAYDQVTAPVEPPYPAACVSMGGSCKCYTQQATRLDMEPALCEAIVAKGFYVAWKQPSQQPVSKQATPGGLPTGGSPEPSLVKPRPRAPLS